MTGFATVVLPVAIALLSRWLTQNGVPILQTIASHRLNRYIPMKFPLLVMESKSICIIYVHHIISIYLSIQLSLSLSL